MALLLKQAGLARCQPQLPLFSSSFGIQTCVAKGKDSYEINATLEKLKLKR
jgi:hypothetical protein